MGCYCVYWQKQNSWPMVKMSKDVWQCGMETWDNAIIKPKGLLLNLQGNELCTLTCQMNCWTDERPSATDNCRATISGVFLSYFLYINSCRCPPAETGAHQFSKMFHFSSMNQRCLYVDVSATSVHVSSLQCDCKSLARPTNQQWFTTVGCSH